MIFAPAAPAVPADVAWRSTNLGARLFAASGRAIAVKLAMVHAAGFGDMTATQLALFHGLDAAGTRPALLATRARLSKASIAELVDRAETGGLVARRPAVRDARGQMVVPTAAGAALLAALAAGVAAAERDVVAAIGTDAATQLRLGLVRYLAATASPGERTLVANGGPGEAAPGSANLGRLLALAAARFTATVATAVGARGFAATPALLGMIRHLDIGGSRLTDLAAAARMTKPAMRELVDRGVALGFVARALDPADRRARRITFTPRGLALLAAVHASVASAEAGFAACIGTDAAAAIRGALARLGASEQRAAA